MVPANTFNDVDVGDTLSYSATLSDGSALPSWLTFNRRHPDLHGHAAERRRRLHRGHGDGRPTATRSASDTFRLTIANTNDAPTVANRYRRPDRDGGQRLQLRGAGEHLRRRRCRRHPDLFGDAVRRLGAACLADVQPGNRTFSGTPLNADVGSIAVTVTATDGSNASASDTFRITIANTNDAPTVAIAIADQAATEDSAFSFAVPANTFADVDVGDTLSYSATLSGGSALPSWLAFNPGNRTFSGTPLNADVGFIEVTVTATDGSNTSVSDTFRITIANTNDAPTVANPIRRPERRPRTAPFSFVFPANTFTDVDVGDTLSYSATLAGGSALPAWLASIPDTRTFSGTPLNADVGTIAVTVTATDGCGIGASDTFGITIANTNDAPTVAIPIADQSATEDSAFSFRFRPTPSPTSMRRHADLLGHAGRRLGAAGLADVQRRDTGPSPARRPNADVGVIAVTVTATDGSNAGRQRHVHASPLPTPTTPRRSPILSPTRTRPRTAPSASQFRPTPSPTSTPATRLTLHRDAGRRLGAAGLAHVQCRTAHLLRHAARTPTSARSRSRVTATDGNGGTSATRSRSPSPTPTTRRRSPTRSPTRRRPKTAPFSFQFAGQHVRRRRRRATRCTLLGDAAATARRCRPGCRFNAATRTFSGTPANADVGTIAVRVTATDGNGGSVNDTFTLTVANTNDAPTRGQRDRRPERRPRTRRSASSSRQHVHRRRRRRHADLLGHAGDGSALPAWLSFNAATRTFIGHAGQRRRRHDRRPRHGDRRQRRQRQRHVHDHGRQHQRRADGREPDRRPERDRRQRRSSSSSPANTFADVDAGDTLTYAADAGDGSALPAWLSFNAATAHLHRARRPTPMSARSRSR